MNLLLPFLRLIRWPNLVFIALTQALFYFCIYLPLYHQPQTAKAVLLMLASVFIAAAGYIINDYFDVNIDRINKPEKNVVDRAIHRRWAIIWHLVLSLAGLVLTACAVRLHYWYLIVANLGCVALLWFYSTSFKRQLLVGNLVISLLTAWTILVFFFAFSNPSHAFNTPDPLSVKFFRLAFLYAGFAFVISLVREAIKDMEDLEGDARYGCKTLPVVAGIRTTKTYTAVWLVVLVATLTVLQFYVLQFGWWPSVVYAFLRVILPLLLTLKKLRSATSKEDYAALSKQTKNIMLSGILSMIFFAIYF
ncbi:geranylgeranylglycerol-phosphate geranylgeranyltransferase [Flavisolibacter ginsenosidimutans]|uniref:Ubiquinone biosynthesis protein UbiA n=1 Tax=Flavisolibacter ginsenosidimutans TaxID=661481 RepID=A0A5B8UFT0_9BACT|nr:geranylgeranylglycerol-phosphate geranylgeranyltransferase [Flavisolibacter ginsenosidimutans]QEC54950.1 ubiquinone biosynthesis protein UbiA [Flavisolibacter ginsenosidimutans]